MHQGPCALLHEMFIALLPSSYVQPHKHPDKVESFHVVFGSVDVVVFDDSGDVIDVIELGMGDQRRSIYYRMSEPFYHTLIIRSDILIVHEITNGPFEEGKTDYAYFAPSEINKSAAEIYMTKLLIKVNKFLGSSK
jgi:cupin fold WbuC family metalloprotein